MAESKTGFRPMLVIGEARLRELTKKIIFNHAIIQ